MRLVKIDWVDSRQPIPTWQLLSDLTGHDPCHCVSVGYLIQDDNNAKVLAPNMAEIESEQNIQASGIMTIPASCVTKITELIEI